MTPTPKTSRPIVPPDRDVAAMSESDLQAYAATLPSAEYPPLRWAGDAMDALTGADGKPFGPPQADDLDVLFAPGPEAVQGIGNRTVVDLGTLLRAFEERCRAQRGEDPRTWPALMLMRCLIKRCEVDGLVLHAQVRIVTCVFLGPAKLAFCRLARGGDFLGSLFAGPARFIGTTFEQSAHFHAAVFLRGAWFHETRFEGETRFNETTFNGPLSLEHARFAESLDLARAVLAGMTWLDLSGLRVGGRMALAADLKIRLDQIHGRILGEHGESLAEPERRAPNRGERGDALSYAADQYSVMTSNFAASAGPAAWRDADRCHSRYLDLWRRVSWLRGDYWSWAKGLLFKAALGNGIWLKYPLELALAVILGFGLIYALAMPYQIRADNSKTLTPYLDSAPAAAAPAAGGAEAAKRPAQNEVGCLCDIEPGLPRILTALYFSASTFTTVGYGDWHPIGWARLFAAAEALSGITIMSAFTVILVRKIIR